MSTNTTSSTDPSAVALTTVFTPATTCNGLTFSSPSYSIWYNEPVPLPSVTETGCYPSQWLNGYTSLSTSSVAVALNPLVCPQGWTTAYNTTSSYLACCPTGYAVNFPSATVDPQRPAYGGLCFSDFTAGTSLTVVEYNATAMMQTQTVPFSTSGQVFAHIIDGYATKHALATSGSNATTSATTVATSSHGGLSGGAIAGVVIGCIAAVVFLLAAALLFLRRRKQKQAAQRKNNNASKRPEALVNESGSSAIYESDPAAAVSEKDGYPTASSRSDSAKRPVELSSGQETAFELQSPVQLAPVELDTPFGEFWGEEHEGHNGRGGYEAHEGHCENEEYEEHEAHEHRR